MCSRALVHGPHSCMRAGRAHLPETLGRAALGVVVIVGHHSRRGAHVQRRRRLLLTACAVSSRGMPSVLRQASGQLVGSPAPWRRWCRPRRTLPPRRRRRSTSGGRLGAHAELAEARALQRFYFSRRSPAQLEEARRSCSSSSSAAPGFPVLFASFLAVFLSFPLFGSMVGAGRAPLNGAGQRNRPPRRRTLLALLPPAW